MSKSKFKLGPLQKLWIKSLREHPERQTTSVLGEGTPKNYNACCLGELHLCYHRLHKKKLPFNKNGCITDNHNEVLHDSFEKYGLNDSYGGLELEYPIFSRESSLEKYGSVIPYYDQLAEANDSGISWSEIANFVEKYPELVFNKSV